MHLLNLCVWTDISMHRCLLRLCFSIYLARQLACCSFCSCRERERIVVVEVNMIEKRHAYMEYIIWAFTILWHRNRAFDVNIFKEFQCRVLFNHHFASEYSSFSVALAIYLHAISYQHLIRNGSGNHKTRIVHVILCKWHFILQNVTITLRNLN